MQISQSATSNVKTVHLQQLLITETLDIEGVLSALNPCSSPSWDILGYVMQDPRFEITTEPGTW
jgi:hypothetical protein